MAGQSRARAPGEEFCANVHSGQQEVVAAQDAGSVVAVDAVGVPSAQLSARHVARR